MAAMSSGGGVAPRKLFRTAGLVCGLAWLHAMSVCATARGAHRTAEAVPRGRVGVQPCVAACHGRLCHCAGGAPHRGSCSAQQGGCAALRGCMPWAFVPPAHVCALHRGSCSAQQGGGYAPPHPRSLFLEKSDQKTRHAPFGQIPFNRPFFRRRA